MRIVRTIASQPPLPPPTVNGVEEIVLQCAECRQLVRSDDTAYAMCGGCGGELYAPGRCLEKKRGLTSRGGAVHKVYCLRPAGHEGLHRATSEWA